MNAYRQWPVKQPSHNATFLHTRHGLTLWFHMAMCFGATASVWNFNRVADPCSSSLVMLLLIMGWHYVDDVNGLEYAEHAHNAFHAFSDLFHVLGLRVKESKAQPPQRQHVLQGVDVHIQNDGVTLSPTTRRVQNLQHAIRQALRNDYLTPREASRLAGKLGFLTQAVFGSLGRSALQPIYARSHDTSAENDDTLSS